MKSDTRTRMLDTTGRLMQRQGYYGTGLNQIVAEARAPKGSMYFHFPGGKEQLAAEAIAAAGRRIDSWLERHRGVTARDSIDAYISALIRTLERSEYAEGCPIATVALEIGPHSDLVGKACREAVDLLTQRVAAWIEADGHDAPTAHDRAMMIYATIEGTMMFAKASRSTQPLDRVRASLDYLVPSPTGTSA